MVKIRLSRSGAKKKAFYKIVVTDHRRRRDSGFIDSIGFYNPFATENEEGFRVDYEKLDYWKENGAKLSLRMACLLKQKSKKAS